MPVIEHIEIYQVAMPLLQPFRTAFGGDETAIESVLVCFESNGTSGCGEVCPWRDRHYSRECEPGVF